MEITMVLKQDVLTSLSVVKGIMKLETNLFCLTSNATLPLPFCLWEEDESFHL